jgi:hypothetical protein
MGDWTHAVAPAGGHDTSSAVGTHASPQAEHDTSCSSASDPVVYEVLAASGACLYRGADVELACAVFDAEPGPGIRFRRLEGGRWRRVQMAPTAAAPVADAEVDDEATYWLTPAGYAATERAAAIGTAGMFVVDTTDIADLARRCPELFAPRDTAVSW